MTLGSLAILYLQTQRPTEAEHASRDSVEIKSESVRGRFSGEPIPHREDPYGTRTFQSM